MARRSQRGPVGADLLAVVRRESSGVGWPPGLTLLTGDDAYHLDAAQRELLAALVPDDASEFALTVYGEQSVDIGAVVSAARSVGMFCSRRVVLVRDVAALEGDPRGLEEFASRPPAASFLLIRAPQLDRRRKLHQMLIKTARVLEFDAAAAAADPARLARDVTALAQAKGLEIDRPAATFLGEACAADFYRIDGELEKIRAWLGESGSKRVNLATVRELAALAGLLSGWEVADALLQRDTPAALVALRRVLEGGDDPLRVLGGLAFRARAMLQAKALLAEGLPAARAFPAARLFGDRYENIARGLARYSISEIAAFPSLLLAADVTLKSRSIDPRAVLEGLVERLTLTGAEPLRERRLS